MATRIWSGGWRGRLPTGDIHCRSREIVRSTGGIVRGKFPSRKNGRTIHHEGLLELDAIYHFEASPLIARYREQPDQVHFPDGKTLRRYTPDFELQLLSGSIVLVEIKPIRSLKDPDVKHKFNCVIEHFERTGQAFEIISEPTLRKQPRLANLRTIYHRAVKKPQTAEALSIVVDRHRHAFPMPLEQATALLEKHAITPYCLLLVGFLHCDLNQPLATDTQLHLTEENNHEWLLSKKGLGF